MTRRALVTGSAGFVGRHMVAALQRDGWELRTADIAQAAALPGPNDVRSWWHAHPSVAEAYDLVVHCAAVVGGRTMIDGAPLELACHDLAIDAAFFDWCRRAQPRHVVYYSSSAAYPVRLQDGSGEFNCYDGSGRLVQAYPPKLGERDIDPSDPELPDATYGWVKLTGERLARELATSCPDVSVHVLRPFSGYGEDQALDYPFPAIAQRVARDDDPVVVWGDGTQVRDWVHIDDVIGATLAVVEADYTDSPVNICTGRATSFAELAQLMIDATGYAADWCTDPSKPTGVHYRVGDPTLMRRFWTPEVTLEQGIERMLVHLSAGAAT